MSNLLFWLENWYKAHCNGDWEHEFGVTITTLDNPGWRVSIDLEDTELENFSLNSYVIERTEEDWIHCFLKDKHFEGCGGVENLNEILEYFKNWVTSNGKMNDR